MAPNDDSDNRVPRLVNRADFKNWTIRLKHHLCSIDNDLWKSIDKGPHIPTQTAPDSASTYTKDSTEPYPEDNLSAEDLRKVKNDSKAYSLMCKGLPLQVLSRLDTYPTGYTLFKALKSICEGDLQDLNDRLLCALPSSWKQTVTLLKHTEKFPMDLDLLIAKIEEVEIDESSRNTDRTGSHAQYKYIVNPANTVENAFLAQDATKFEDEGDLFVGASFYTDSSYIPNSPTYSQPQSPPRAQVQSQNVKNQSESQSSTVQAKVKDVMNILLQDDETKNAFTAFMASFQAYQGSHLTQMDVVLQDLFEMDPDDVEEMDLNWQMVMVAYRTQKHAYVNRSYKPHANKTVGFDKSKARCFNCNCYGHFSRECKAPKNQNYNDQASSSGQNQGQGQSSQQSSSYQQRNQRFIQKPYQSLPMPKLEDEGKKPEDQTKALVVSVKDGYDWSAYVEQFTSDLTSSLALVCEIEEDWSEEGDGKLIDDVSEDSEEYDWSAKSDPVEESESEIALMATSSESSSSTEQPKVSTDLPPNYVPLPDDVRGRLCSEQCIQQVEHYRTHSFKIGDKLSKHEKIHEQLKIDDKIADEKILSLKESWNKTLKELELVTKQLEEMTKNFEQEKVAHAVTQVELTKPVLIQLVEYPELNPKEEETVKEEGEFSGYNDPEYIRWKNEQKAKVADQLIKKKEVKQSEVSKAKVQKSNLTVNQSETKSWKGTFDLNGSYGKPINSSFKSNSGLKTGSCAKSSVVNDKRIEPKKVTKQDSLKSNQVPKQAKSQSKSPQKNQVNLKPNKTDNESRVGSTSKVNNRLFRISKKHCEICDRYNHVTAECFFNRYCSYCDKRNHSSEECFYNKFCDICERRNHETKDCFFRKNSSREMTPFPNFQRNQSFGFQNVNQSHSPVLRNFNRNNSGSNNFSSRNVQVNSFKPRALMVRNQKFENNLDPKLEERFIALRRKQLIQANGRNSFQPNLSNATNFQNLHYQQVRPRRPINSWFVDSGCSRHMTGNHALLQDFKLKNGTHVAFGGDAGGKITGEGTVSNGVISFDKVNYCAQLNFNLLSVSQICDKSYSTLFDDSFCYILKPGFKIDNEWVVVKAPRDRDVYKLDMSQIDAETETTCLIAHASNDESQLWHRRLGHSNFRNMNRLVTGNHAVGILSKKFSTTDLCPACLKSKQHRMSFKSKP
ncbi:hypothetical protein QVD17_12228 [Tagetes erecta]|uniref:CCHC-type domain-containing protein n=1 Tax=Tagetes erecta TaxID=13708 RepID=A0AAD8NVJ6_TARER|nr:hypothetical protein QVD17_12228 [Tagetes erecta]